MTQNVGGVSGDVLYATYNYASSPVAGGTDITADTAGNMHGWLFVGDYNELDVDVIITFTGGVTPTAVINLDRALANDVGATQPTFASNVATATSSGTPSTQSFSAGAGLSNSKGFGRFVRITWGTITGSPTAMNIVVSIVGKAA